MLISSIVSQYDEKDFKVFVTHVLFSIFFVTQRLSIFNREISLCPIPHILSYNTHARQKAGYQLVINTGNGICIQVAGATIVLQPIYIACLYFTPNPNPYEPFT
jgi:hypothetical protein